MKKIIIAGLVFFLQINTVFAQTFAYITNAASPSSISSCALNPTTGQFESCELQYLNDLSTPLDIAITKIQNHTYAYITNSNYPAVVTQCSVAQNGQLLSCAQTDVPSYTGITFYESDALYAYLSMATSVQKCRVDQNGTLHDEHCDDSGAGSIFLNGPIYTTFKQFNHVTYAYIANGDYHRNARVVKCTVTSNGNFSQCVDSGAGDLNGAADIDFVSIDENTYAYITQSGGSVSKCEVDLNGFLNQCTKTGGDFYTPIGMNIHKIDNTFYAYIVDGGFRAPNINAISQCEILFSGDLECKDAGVGAIFANPFGIALW